MNFRLLFLLLAAPALGGEMAATWTDPALAKAEDPDFSIQGEYGRGQAGRGLGRSSGGDEWRLVRGLPPGRWIARSGMDPGKGANQVDRQPR